MFHGAMMLQLPIQEMIPLIGIGVLSLICVFLSHRRLMTGREVFARALPPLITLSVCLEVMILMFRAMELQAIPLTGLFESMLMMTTVFSLIFLFLGIGIHQAWFGTVMTWLILVLVVLSMLVAAPASEPMPIAATPWAITHAIAMICGTAAMTFAVACAWLYLVASHRLKQKKLNMVLGRIPNIEWLKRGNELSLIVSFVLLTVGVICGLGMAVVEAATLGVRLVELLRDPKVLLILITWIMLAIHLTLWRWGSLSERAVARITLVVFALVLVAVVGVTVFWGTSHVFSYKLMGT